MTTYTAIPDTDIDPESPVTVGLMTLLRDNPLAIQEGDATAPKIANAALVGYPWAAGSFAANAIAQSDIQASAVGQAELKSSAGTVSRTTLGVDHYTLPGGAYGLYPETMTTRPGGTDGGVRGCYFLGGNYLAESGAYTNVAEFVTVTDWDSYASYISLSFVNRSYSDTTMNARQRYINASPPYDLGDGVVPAFVFAKLDGNGAVESLYIADDPPWAHNGPTDTRPTFVDRSGKYIDVFVSEAAARACEQDPTCEAAIADYVALRQRRAGRIWTPAARDLVPVRVPVDQRIKNADMAIVPHPFANEADKTIVLLDPVSDLVERIAYLHQTGEDVVDVVTRWLQIDNNPLQRNAPAGVLPVAARFRQTRRA